MDFYIKYKHLCKETVPFCRTVKKRSDKKGFKVIEVEHIHTHTNGCHGMDKKSNFGLNLQKWVCLRNTKFLALHILSPLKNTNPLPLPWNTYYYVVIFTIFHCKQTNMVVCHTSLHISTPTNFRSYGYKQTLQDQRNAE